MSDSKKITRRRHSAEPGYKSLFASGVTEAGCIAHARRKFHELWVNHKSSVGEQALALFGKLYDVEREVADLDAARRRTIRLERAKPIADALRTSLTAQRQKVPPGSATAKAIDHTLGRWAALTRYIDDRNLPADDNWAENQIRPIAIGRSHDPYAYLRDVLERRPTQRASEIGELLPHRWKPVPTTLDRGD